MLSGSTISKRPVDKCTKPAIFAIQAAVDGLGVAVVDPSLAAGEIESGRLIQPFRQTLTRENAYYLVYPEAKSEDPSIIALQNWLLEESTEPLAFDTDDAILATSVDE